MSEQEPRDGVRRRVVLAGIGVALAAGLTGFAVFTALGPASGDDDRGRQEQELDREDPGEDEPRDEPEPQDEDERDVDPYDDRSGPDRGRG